MGYHWKAIIRGNEIEEDHTGTTRVDISSPKILIVTSNRTQKNTKIFRYTPKKFNSTLVISFFNKRKCYLDT